MAQPKLRVNELLAELTPPNVVSDFRAHRIIRECRALLPKVTDVEHAALLHSTIGIAYRRLKNARAAIDALKVARRLNPANGDTAANLGCAYLSAHEYDSALLEFEFATTASSHPVIAWANLAETKLLLDDYEGCMEAFAKAVSIADHANRSDAFVLAAQAAEIGLEREAHRLWFEWIRLRGGGEVMLESDMEILDHHPALRRAVLARPRPAAIARMIEEAPCDMSPSVDAEHMRVFEDFSDARKRANAAVLVSSEA